MVDADAGGTIDREEMANVYGDQADSLFDAMVAYDAKSKRSESPYKSRSTAEAEVLQVAAIWRTVMIDCMYQISLQTWIQYFSKEIDDTFRNMVLSAMERSLQLQEVSCSKNAAP